MSLLWPAKDPDEVLDYQLDWSEELARGGDDTITASSWTISGTGLTQNTAAFTGTTTTIWLSAGTIGTVYSILNRVETEAGRTIDQTVSIRISPK